MLRSIHVKNLALIDEEEILLKDGLNILTGETGAGKSIIIGSVSAALGTGSLKDLVREGADYAMVELNFETDSPEAVRLLNEMELPVMDGCVIISRNYRNGRSTSRINGETVTVAKVREIAASLIDIHGQHEHQSLLYPRYHLELVDSFADRALADRKRSCQEHFRAWQEASRQLEKAMLDEKDRARQIDFLSFEIGEIEEASLREGEDEELEARYRKLSNAQKILESVGEAEQLTGSDSGALMNISAASGILARVSHLDESLQDMSVMLSQIEDLCNDFNRSIASFLDDFNYDERELDEIAQRLDLINRLKTKYGKTIPDILAYHDRQAETLKRLTDYDAYVAGIQKKLEESRQKLRRDCDAITRLRKESASQLSGLIRQSLEELNFLDVRFEILFDPLKEMTENGADAVVFHISTNPGMPLRPLQSVASGGELSRIMLGIKTVMANKDSIGTLIFDEIDTGISGRTAQKVSEKMAKLSRSRQVIAITHLAQIASMADAHYLIEKSVQDGVTRTHVRELNPDEIIEELTRILGGARITDTVRKSAEEMKRLADQQKLLD
ncbi:MAG TPA: DNA repair protein RecN [Lachnospiraceae bacterium]|nr:DNA repair protein RecN [Lachnospiraceae bacterium]